MADSSSLIKIGLIGGAAWLAYQWYLNSQASVASAPVSTPVPASGSAPIVVAPAAPPQMTITTSRGNNAALNAGDTYTVTLTGYAPNAPVLVTAVETGNPTPVTAISSMTDANGNFTSTGTASLVGTWTETWNVNGQPIGTWAFTVSPVAGVAGYGRGLGALPVPLPVWAARRRLAMVRGRNT